MIEKIARKIIYGYKTRTLIVTKLQVMYECNALMFFYDMFPVWKDPYFL